MQAAEVLSVLNVVVGLVIRGDNVNKYCKIMQHNCRFIVDGKCTSPKNMKKVCTNKIDTHNMNQEVNDDWNDHEQGYSL